MMSVIIWIVAAIVLLSVMTFPGKSRMLSGEDEVADAAKNFIAVSLLLMLIMYPLYSDKSYGTDLYYRILVRDYPVDLSDIVSHYLRTIRYIQIEKNDAVSFELFLGFYAFIILCSVFLFFTGMYVYKNGLKIRHKILLILPVVMSVVGVADLAASYKKLLAKDPGNLVLSVTLRLTGIIIEYLASTAVMIVILYLVYKILKTILRCEILPLIIVLILSFFSPEYWNSRGVRVPDLTCFIWGANIPLFPIGMLVMKYKDKFLPKSLKWTVIWSVAWTGLGAASFYTLMNLQSFFIKQSGISVPGGGCGVDVEPYTYFDTDKLIVRVSRATAIPWLILGLSIVMLLLLISLRIKTGNKFTLFLRKHIEIVLILSLCQYICRYNIYVDPVKDLLAKIRIEDPVITSVVWLLIYFCLAVVLKRFVLDRIKAKQKA